MLHLKPFTCSEAASLQRPGEVVIEHLAGIGSAGAMRAPIALPDSPHTPCEEDTWSAFLNLLDTTEEPSWLQALQLRAVP